MLLFAPALDPAVTTYPIQHHLSGWNGKVGGDLPIVEAETLHNRSLAHVGDIGRRFVSHFFFAFVAGFSPMSFEKISSVASIMPLIASGRVTGGSCLAAHASMALI